MNVPVKCSACWGYANNRTEGNPQERRGAVNEGGAGRYDRCHHSLAIGDPWLRWPTADWRHERHSCIAECAENTTRGATIHASRRRIMRHETRLKKHSKPVLHVCTAARGLQLYLGRGGGSWHHYGEISKSARQLMKLG